MRIFFFYSFSSSPPVLGSAHSVIRDNDDWIVWQLNCDTGTCYMNQTSSPAEIPTFVNEQWIVKRETHRRNRTRQERDWGREYFTPFHGVVPIKHSLGSQNDFIIRQNGNWFHSVSALFGSPKVSPLHSTVRSTWSEPRSISHTEVKG